MYGYKNLQWAIVSGHLTQYQDGTLEHYLSEHDNKTPLVRWQSPAGLTNVTTADNFKAGTLKELQAILNENERIHQEKVQQVLAKMPLATNTEKLIVDYMIGDGYDPEELTYEEVQDVTIGCFRYREFNHSLLDCYMDFMH